MTRTKKAYQPTPCVLEICVWRDPELSYREKIEKCAECFKRNDMRQQETEWCRHFIEHYVMRDL